MMDLRHSHATRFGSLICLRVATRRLVAWDHVECWERETVELVRRLQPTVLLMDLERVERCSKEAVNALLQMQRRLRSLRCRLELCGLSPAVADVLQVLKMDKNVFRIHATLKEALRTDRWEIESPDLADSSREPTARESLRIPDQA